MTMTMQMQLMQNKNPALRALAVIRHLGLGISHRDGLGIPGPFGAVPNSVMAAGTYEISGTDVNFRQSPGTSGEVLGIFNSSSDGKASGDFVIGPPDQVAFDGQVANKDGLSWAAVTAKGQKGYVAVMYMAPVGWTAQQGKVQPASFTVDPLELGKRAVRGDPDRQTTTTTTTTSTTTMGDYTIPILIGAAVIGAGIIGYAFWGKKRMGGGKMGKRKKSGAKFRGRRFANRRR